VGCAECGATKEGKTAEMKRSKSLGNAQSIHQGQSDDVEESPVINAATSKNVDGEQKHSSATLSSPIPDWRSGWSVQTWNTRKWEDVCSAEGVPKICSAEEVRKILLEYNDAHVQVKHKKFAKEWTAASGNMDFQGNQWELWRVLLGHHAKRRLAQREFSSRRDSPVMVRLLQEIIAAQDN